MQVEILTYLCHTYHDACTPDFMHGDITIAITLNVKKLLSSPPTLNVKIVYIKGCNLTLNVKIVYIKGCNLTLNVKIVYIKGCNLTLNVKIFDIKG